MRGPRVFAMFSTIALTGSAEAETPPGPAIPVTVENFVRAETDMYLTNFYKRGGLGAIHSESEPASIDKQDVIRLNRDTLYSFGVFDLDAGPVTVTLPDAGDRFMSLEAISEDHYALSVMSALSLISWQPPPVGAGTPIRMQRTSESFLNRTMGRRSIA